MSKKIIKILMLIICIGVIFTNTKVKAKTGKIINDATRIREEASTSSEIIEIAEEGDSAEILSEEGEWYKVKYANKTGYIRKDMLNIQDESKKEDKTAENNVTENKTIENSVQNNVTNEAEENKLNENKEENKASENIKENKSDENNNEIKNVDNEISNLKVGDKRKLANSLEIKILPTITSSVIATIYENTEISVKSIINKWCYIETDNSSGWVLISKIKNLEQEQIVENPEIEKVEDEKKEEPQEEKEEKQETKSVTKTSTKYVSTETLNVREKAQNDANIIKQLTLNTEVIVSEEIDKTWSKVTAKGVTGYVASKYLADEKVTITSRSEDLSRQQNVTNETQENEEEEEEKEEKEEEQQQEKTESKSNTSSVNTAKKSQSASSEGREVVQYALQFVGNPYVYGGTSLTNGCDCSGFVMSVYAHFGYSLPHSSGSQQSVGVAVSKSDLQPGDILCFSGHVGIYVGGDTFVHAANANKGIITSSLSSSYYVKNYICARRVL